MISKIFPLVAVLFFVSNYCEAQTKTWGERIAETIIKTYPDSIVVKKAGELVANRPTRWDYEQGVLLKAFDVLGKQTGNNTYFKYTRKIIDQFVQPNGSIRTYESLDYNIDNITPGRVVLDLYRETKEEKYKIAANLLHEQLVWQPRTKEGGFWHKHRYPYQMWLDGLYMAGPFSAEYAKMFNESNDFDDVVNQFIWMENHVRDSKTGLLYHAWDESKKQRWANPITGQAPGLWGRGMGWYAMSIVDVLDYLPMNHPKRNDLIIILQHLATALKKYQDPTSGVWYQVIDKGTVKGNYLEASASCMFVYAFAKGARMGYLDKSFVVVAKKGYEGILNNFIETDSNGLVHLTKTVSVGGLGGVPYRDGSFEYYISEPIRTDDLKGVGPFIQASIEIELMLK